jgi:hypothetical protein
MSEFCRHKYFKEYDVFIDVFFLYSQQHDNMLRAMFSGRMEVLTDAEGWILIDRCGKHFGSILNFLRDEDVPLPDRSGSSHVFTIPEYTNLRIYNFFFTTRYNFWIEIKLWKKCYLI